MSRLRVLLLLGATVVAALGLVVTGALPASAHAVVIGSTPTDGQTLATAPDQVTITFSENVSSELGGLTVLNSSGTRVDNNDSQVGAGGNVLRATLQSNLTDGTYVMNYRVISADGHPIAAAIVFGVGNTTVIDTSGVKNLQAGRDPGFEFAAGVARFVTYVGALLAAGLALFLTFLHDQRPDRWKIAPIVRGAAVAGGIGAVATVAIQAALVTGNGFSAMTDVTTLRETLTQGLDWATLLILAGLALVHVSADVSKRVVAQSLAFYGSLIVAASFAVWGHSSTTDPRWLSFVADFVHVATAAIWFGGLVGLGATLWRRRRLPSAEMSTDIDEPVAVGATNLVNAGAPDRGAVSSIPVEPLPPLLASDDDTEEGEDEGLATSTAGIVARFSTLAGISLFLLVIAGTFMAWKELGSFSALWSTTYGRAILIKIGIAVVIIGVAAYNRYRLVPRIQADELAEHDSARRAAALSDERPAWRHLTRSVVGEVIGIVVVLGVTSVLVNITPPKNASSVPTFDTVQDAAVANTSATLEVGLSPEKVGSNAVHITYLDANRRTVDLAQQVSVEMTQPDKGIGPIQRDATKASGGHYIIEDLQVPTAGKWTMTVITRVSDFDQERTDFTFNVSS